jgi:hypothetical protein
MSGCSDRTSSHSLLSPPPLSLCHKGSQCRDSDSTLHIILPIKLNKRMQSEDE